LRRHAPSAPAELLRVGHISLDVSTHRVSVDGESVKVGPTEFKLLAHFMKHAERVHSRVQLLDQVWGDDTAIEERTVDVHVKRLREALGEWGVAVETVRGAGYRLTAQATLSKKT
jgi:two-component system phosphate regulon response regulator PhoB